MRRVCAEGADDEVGGDIQQGQEQPRKDDDKREDAARCRDADHPRRGRGMVQVCHETASQIEQVTAVRDRKSVV